MASRAGALRGDAVHGQVHAASYGAAWRLMAAAAASAVALASAAAVAVSVRIVYPREPAERPFCGVRRMLEALPAAASREEALAASSERGGVFAWTEEEAAEFYWMVVFVPSAVVFAMSALYLVADMVVVYAAPRRHLFLGIVENDFCASRRGGVQCLSIINAVFALIFALMALFLGSSLLTVGSSCAIPLFWSYEIASWGLVILYGGTAFLLKRKAAVSLEEGSFAGRNFGLEMLESPIVVTPEMQRRLHEGFKSWMGSPLSDDDDDSTDEYASDNYTEHTEPLLTKPPEQRDFSDV